MLDFPHWCDIMHTPITKTASSMKKKIDFLRFEDLVETSLKLNGRAGFKRFYSIASKDGSHLVLGMYDYATKKYALSGPTVSINRVLDEIDEMLTKAAAAKR